MGQRSSEPDSLACFPRSLPHIRSLLDPPYQLPVFSAGQRARISHPPAVDCPQEPSIFANESCIIFYAALPPLNLPPSPSLSRTLLFATPFPGRPPLPPGVACYLLQVSPFPDLLFAKWWWWLLLLLLQFDGPWFDDLHPDSSDSGFERLLRCGAGEGSGDAAFSAMVRNLKRKVQQRSGGQR